MSENRFNEILEEFRTVFKGRGSTIDAVISPLVFLVINAIWGLTAAMWTSLAIAATLTVLRLVRRQPWLYALFGMLGRCPGDRAFPAHPTGRKLLPANPHHWRRHAVGLHHHGRHPQAAGCAQQPPHPQLAAGLVCSPQSAPGIQ